MQISTTPTIEMLPIGTLKPYARNARTHSKKQLKQIAESITGFGFTNPVLVSDELEIIAGHGRVLAAQGLGFSTVPTIRLSHLSAEERRAYVLADNKLAENAGWDLESPWATPSAKCVTYGSSASTDCCAGTHEPPTTSRSSWAMMSPI